MLRIHSIIAGIPIVFLAGTLFVFAGTETDKSTTRANVKKARRMRVPDSATAVEPLGVGKKAPAVKVRDINGKKVNLKDLFEKKPTVLIFYRGGWCPYCNLHLGKLAKVENELVKEGFQLVGVSPDSPAMLRGDAKKKKFAYTLLSDSDVVAAKAFGLAFRVDDETLKKYKGFGIDLEKRSGKNHHILPVPAAYVIDSDRTIRFVYYNSDYKKRIDAGDLLKAAKAIRKSR